MLRDGCGNLLLLIISPANRRDVRGVSENIAWYFCYDTLDLFVQLFHCERRGDRRPQTRDGRWTVSRGFKFHVIACDNKICENDLLASAASVFTEGW